MTGLEIVGETTAYPTLKDAAITRLVAFGDIERFEMDTILSAQGERADDFFVVLEGIVELPGVSDDGYERVVTLKRGQFTGEIDLAAGRARPTVARIRGSAEVLRIRQIKFRTLLSVEAHVGEIIIRAFIYRRMNALKTGFNTVGDTCNDAAGVRRIRLSIQDSKR